MSYKLFLDDYRKPSDCAIYMQKRIGYKASVYTEEDWVIVKNYEDFKDTIEKKGLPYLISFDHDLADVHYGAPVVSELDFETASPLPAIPVEDEKTGLSCAIWLGRHCQDNSLKLPDYFVHSLNPAGSINIQECMEYWSKIFKNVKENQ